MKRRWIKIAVAMAVITTIQGCSLTFVRPPPPRHLWGRIGWARCTRSKVWPIFDALFAAGTAVTTALPFMSTDPPDTSSVTGQASVSGREPLNVTMGLLQIAGWGFSAAYGFRTTDECAAFWRDQVNRQRMRSSRPPMDAPATIPLAPRQPAPQPQPEAQPPTTPNPAEPPPAQPTAPPPG